jgi:predicted RNase H-like HicB family nuclease
MSLTAVYQKVDEGYIAFIEEVPGANTQGETLEEARANLVEAVEMVMDANRFLAEERIKGMDIIKEPFQLAA